MRLQFVPICGAVALLAGAVGASSQSAATEAARSSKDQPAPRQVAIDPRSSREAEAELVAEGFGKFCPNISIIRDETKAEYVILASESDPWRGFLLHYYITVYDKQGTVVFAADKHHDKGATKAACLFINTHK